MALIVIEGVDRTGKSELAAALSAEYDSVDVMHFGPPKESAVKEYLGPLLDYDPRVDNVVCDRFHLGETVWPTYFDRPKRLRPAEKRLIDLFLHTRGAILVHCTRDYEDLQQAFRDADPPEPLPVEKVVHASMDFKNVVEETKQILPTVEYDHSQREELVPKIVKFATMSAIISYTSCSESARAARAPRALPEETE